MSLHFQTSAGVAACSVSPKYVSIRLNYCIKLVIICFENDLILDVAFVWRNVIDDLQILPTRRGSYITHYK